LQPAKKLVVLATTKVFRDKVTAAVTETSDIVAHYSDAAGGALQITDHGRGHLGFVARVRRAGLGLLQGGGAGTPTGAGLSRHHSSSGHVHGVVTAAKALVPSGPG